MRRSTQRSTIWHSKCHKPASVVIESPVDSADAAGNLFEPAVSGLYRAKGRFEGRERATVIRMGTSRFREWLLHGALAVILLLILLACLG